LRVDLIGRRDNRRERVFLAPRQREPDRTTQANQEMDSGASELRRSTLRDQAARMKRDFGGDAPQRRTADSDG
jgi:hypothetical protein